LSATESHRGFLDGHAGAYYGAENSSIGGISNRHPGNLQLRLQGAYPLTSAANHECLMGERQLLLNFSTSYSTLRSCLTADGPGSTGRRRIRLRHDVSTARVKNNTLIQRPATKHLGRHVDLSAQSRPGRRAEQALACELGLAHFRCSVIVFDGKTATRYMILLTQGLRRTGEPLTGEVLSKSPRP
jgi:hypothetical protein